MSAKRRRSKRVAKSERVMLKLTEPTAVQDIVVTLEVSAHGAKVLSRRKMAKDSRGTAHFIAAGREVPCRVVWQKPPGAEGRMETGIEIFSNTNFWGLDLTGSEIEEPVPAVPAAALLEALEKRPDPAQLWCKLVDALEAKGVFTRQELVAMLRQLGSKE